MSKLKFNFSERVKLRASHRKINTLLDIDLTPKITMVKLDDGQSKFEGRLQLKGTYLAERYRDKDGEFKENSRKRFSCSIPVDISLPSDKIDPDMVKWAIETFDYELVSPSELDIEATLAISGLTREQPGCESRLIHLESGASSPAMFNTVPSEQALSATSCDKPLEMPAKDNSMSTDTCSVPMKESSMSPGTCKVPMKESGMSPGTCKVPMKESNMPPESCKVPMKESSMPSSNHAMPTSDVTMPNAFDFFNDSPAEESNLAPEAVCRNCTCGKDSAAEAHESKPQVCKTSEALSASPEATEACSNECESDDKADASFPWISKLLSNREEKFTPVRMVVVQNEETTEQLAARCNVSNSQLVRSCDMDKEGLQTGEVLRVRS